MRLRLQEPVRSCRPRLCRFDSRAAPSSRIRALAREELDRCSALGVSGPLGASLRTLGLIEPGVSGIGRLEQAVAHLQRSPTRLEHELALLELGGATRRGGRRADARKPLREALDLTLACGADAIAVRPHDELVAAVPAPAETQPKAASTSPSPTCAALAWPPTA